MWLAGFQRWLPPTKRAPYPGLPSPDRHTHGRSPLSLPHPLQLCYLLSYHSTSPLLLDLLLLPSTHGGHCYYWYYHGYAQKWVCKFTLRRRKHNVTHKSSVV